MGENIVKSEKLNLKKPIKVLWFVIIVLLALFLVFSFIKFGMYHKAQKIAAGFLISTSNKYDYEDDYNEMIAKMYDDLNPYSYNMTVGGVHYDNTESSGYAHKADRILGDLMTEAGYKCYHGSDYLRYIGYFDYTLHNTISLFIIWLVLFILCSAIIFWYNNDQKIEMTINGNSVVCRKGEKTIKQFLINDIKSVETASLKGLKITGDGVKYKLNLLKNGDELKTAIMNTLSTIRSSSAENAPETSTDELKKYKELLDSGIITQEEFDAKKKQIMGL